MSFDADFRDFLEDAGWAGAMITPLQQDASTRQYFRLHKAGETCILMHAPPSSETAHCPVDADPAERTRLGYNAMARLAANDCSAFAGLAGELTARGFSAPRVFHGDLPSGLLLIEDLAGRLVFDHVHDHPTAEPELYEVAVSTLAALVRCTFGDEVAYGGTVWPLQAYDETALLAETGLLTDWYLPHVKGTADPVLVQDLQSAWQAALRPVLSAPPVLTLRDFHAQNLIWLPERNDVARVGLLDFQDAVFGHPAYDLVSLTQDARRDVTPALHEGLIRQFIREAMVMDEAAFRHAYAVLGAQRAAKIMGIFVRLAQRDGKPHYLDLLPRVEFWFAHNLAQAGLEDVRHVAQQAGLIGGGA